MRMRLFVDLLQLCYAVVGVALCSAERGVAHQLLYIAHIGLLVEQVRGEGVSQHVRRAFALHLCPLQLALDNSLDGRAREWFAICRDDERSIA